MQIIKSSILFKILIVFVTFITHFAVFKLIVTTRIYNDRKEDKVIKEC